MRDSYYENSRPRPGSICKRETKRQGVTVEFRALTQPVSRIHGVFVLIAENLNTFSHKLNFLTSFWNKNTHMQTMLRMRKIRNLHHRLPRFGEPNLDEFDL